MSRQLPSYDLRHDLMVTSLLVWIWPTHITTHSVRFLVSLLLLWSIFLWYLRPIMNAFIPQVLSVMFFIAISVAYSWQSYRTTFFAASKPWMNPQIPAVKRLPMHVPLRLFDNVGKARRAACLPNMVAYNMDTASCSTKNEKSEKLTNNVICLDTLGTWEFQLLPTVEEALELVKRETQNISHTNSNAWSEIKVPGNWMLQGFDDIPIYTNKKYPFPNRPPIVPRNNPTGVYKFALDKATIAKLPASWNKNESGKSYSIVLHGVESACFVFFHQECLGFCKDSRLPSEFEIPAKLWHDAVKDSHHRTFYFVVVRWSDGSYMEDQDHWWMAGLHRSVELIQRPARADILDYRVHATAARSLSVDVEMRSHDRKSKPPINLTVRLVEDQQLTADGDEWEQAEGELWSCVKTIDGDANISFSNGESISVSIESESSISNAKLWTAETPYLYTLLLIQSDISTGQVYQVESCRVGFRSVLVQNDGILCVNNSPITVAGINRHEHDPDHGKVVSLERMKQDITVLKKNNFNAVRTSHYPTHSSFYRLCDFYGLYVCDEANVETDGMKPMGRLANDWGWEAAFVSRITRMVQRDYNHACIILWSLGNESGRGRNLVKARQVLQGLDSSRPICYEGGGSLTEGEGTTELTDIVCPMYPSVPKTELLAQLSSDNRPIILCEYSHSMNNSNGNLHLYWNRFWDNGYRRLQGGFIWDMVDQGLRRKHPTTGQEFFAYGGDFGDTINDKQFCINGMFSPDREPHPCVAEIKYLQQPVAMQLPKALTSIVLSLSVASSFQITLQVTNRFSFQELDHLAWEWELCLEYQPNAHISGIATLVDGDTLTVDMSQASDVLSHHDVGAVYLNVRSRLARDQSWAGKGHLVAIEQFPVAIQQYKPWKNRGGDSRNCTNDDPLRSVEDNTTISVARGGDDEPFLVIDKQTGGIQSIKVNGSDVLTGFGILPTFTRPATDNDRGGMELVLDFLHLKWAKPLLQILNSGLFSYEMHWRDHGLSQDSLPVCSCTLSNLSRTGHGEVRIETLAMLESSVGEVIIEERKVYTVNKDSSIHIDVEVQCTKALVGIPSLPRIGQKFTLTKKFDLVKYFGRGSGENYPDRKEGSKMGTWWARPSTMGYSYIVPSENGSRSDCKWVSFESGKEKLIVLSDEVSTFNFSALLHSAQELHDASHTCDLEGRSDGQHDVNVTIDHSLMGLGGDLSWFPCVYDDYLVKPKRYTYTLWLIATPQDEPAEVIIAQHRRAKSQ